MLHLIVSATLLLALTAPARAQLVPSIGEPLSGPRLGVTVVTGGTADRLRDELGMQPVMLQFGWQFETELFRSPTGLTGVTEWIPLAGGLEQGTLLPSISWLVGLRGRSGAEFAIGPNLSLTGVGLALAGGATVPVGGIAVPVNIAVVSGSGGPRLSLLSGFIMGR